MARGRSAGSAVAVVGEPRLTADLDVIVFADMAALRALVTYAVDHGFTANVEAEMEAARKGGSIRLDRGNYHFDVIVRSLFIEDRDSRPVAAAARTFNDVARLARESFSGATLASTAPSTRRRSSS